MTWSEITKIPEWGDLSLDEKSQLRALWYDKVFSPEARKEGVTEDEIASQRESQITTFDTGEGPIASFLGAATQGFLGTGTSAMQGVGALTGITALEEAGKSAQAAVESTFPTNPIYGKTNFVGNVIGNIGSFMVPGGLGAKAGVAASEAASVAAKALQAERALGTLTSARAAELALPISEAAKAGAQAASTAAMFASGAGSKAQEADAMGLTGEAKWLTAALGGLTEVASENIPGLRGMKDEFAALSKIPGLSALSDGTTRGLKQVGAGVARNVAEELVAQVGGNVVSQAMAPEGYNAPDLLAGTPQAAAGGAIGGLMMGGLEAFRGKPATTDTLPVPPGKPAPIDAAIGQAVAAEDPGAAAVLLEAKFKGGAKAQEVQGPNTAVLQSAGDITFSGLFATPAPLPPGEVPVIIAPSPNAPQLWVVDGQPFASEAEASAYQATFTASGAAPVAEDVTVAEMAPVTPETAPAPITQAVPAAETAPVTPEATPAPTTEAAPVAETAPVIEGVPVTPAEVPAPIDTTAPLEEQLTQVAENVFPSEEKTPEQQLKEDKLFESRMLDVNGGIKIDEAMRVLNLLKAIGATNAQIVVNDTGSPDPLASKGRMRGSRAPDANGVDTVWLNRNMLAKDTPVHEALGHGAIVDMQQSNPALFEAGRAVLSNSDLLKAVRGRYAREGYVYTNDSDLMEEVMATALGNNTGDLFAALAGNPKLLQQVKIWIAKAQVWFDEFLANKGVPPGMTIEQWARKVYTHTIAGKVKESGVARPALDLAPPAAPAPVAPAPVEPTPRQTRHRVFEGGSPMRVNPGEGVLDARNPDMAYRLTGQQQIDDILATGEVRAKEGKMRGGRSGETQWSKGHESLGYRAGSNKGMYVIETPSRGLNERLGGLPISAATRIWKSGENGKWEDVTSDIVQAAPTPTIPVEAPPAATAPVAPTPVAPTPVAPTPLAEAPLAASVPLPTQDVELSAEETAALRITSLKGVKFMGDGVWFVPDKLMTAKRLRSLRNERESKYSNSPRGGRNVEIKPWSEVTGDAYAKGYAILDRRTRNKERGAASQTPTATAPVAPIPLVESPPAAAELPVPTTTTNEEIQRQGQGQRQEDGLLQVAEPLPVPSAVGAPAAPTAPAPATPDFAQSFIESFKPKPVKWDTAAQTAAKEKAAMAGARAAWSAEELAAAEEYVKNKNSAAIAGLSEKKRGAVRRYVMETTGTENVRYSLAGDAAMDEEYMGAVESGDVAKQQEIVDAAAKAGGFTKMWNFSQEIGVDPNRAAFYTTSKKDAAESWGEGRPGKVREVFIRSAKPAIEGQNILSSSFMTPELVGKLKQAGFDSVSGGRDWKRGDEVAVFDPNQIKSADPVVRDDQGRIIPPSQRFNPTKSDIRYSLAGENAVDAEYMAAVESGDVAKQQEIVDAAAKAAGYNVGPVWHASDSKFDVFDLSKSKDKYPEFWFTGNKSYASNHGKYVRRFYLRDPYYRGEPEVFTSDRPERIKSADPITRDDQGNITPPSQRFNPAKSDIRYSLAGENAMDEEYMAAVESGDEAKQQELVDAAAKAAGYNVGPVWHGTKQAFTVFDTKGVNEASFFSPNKTYAKAYGSVGRYVLSFKNLFTGADNQWALIKAAMADRFTGYRADDMISQYFKDKDSSRPGWGDTRVFEYARKAGFDGAEVQERKTMISYAVFDPNQIKSAEPVTYDDKGNIIPLSQRFNPAKSDIRYSLAGDNTPEDSDVNLRPSGVAKNRPNSYTRGLFEGMTYQGQSMQEAWDEAAEIYDRLGREDASFEKRMDALYQMRDRTFGNDNNMTPGAFVGWMILEQKDVLQDEEASEEAKEVARDRQQRIVDASADFAAESGQMVKGWHIGIAIAEGWDTMVETFENDAIHGGAIKAKAFKDVAKAHTRILGTLTTETLSSAPAADVTRIVEQRMVDVIRGDESALEGEAENEVTAQVLLDAVAAQDDITSTPWFQRGLAKLSKQLQDDVEAWLSELEYISMLEGIASGASPSLTAAERTAKNVARLKEANILTASDAKAAILTATVKAEALGKKIFAKPPNKPVKTPKSEAEALTLSEEDMNTVILDRFDNVLTFLMNQSKAPKAKSVRDKTINAIVSGLISKAGISVTRAKVTGDQRALAFGLLLQNQQTAAEVVNSVHKSLEEDGTTKGAWKRKNLKALFEVYVGKGFDTPSGADAKSPPYSEKQVTQLINSELKKLNLSLRKVVTDAALMRTTATNLEAQLRDTKRPFANELSPAALDSMVSAVLSQYGKNAKQMADNAAKRKADMALRNAEATRIRELRKEADKLATEARIETRKEIAEAVKDSKGKRALREKLLRKAEAKEIKAKRKAANLLAAADRAETRKAISEAAKESKAKRRALIKQKSRDVRRARRENSQAIRKAREAGAAAPAIAPLTYQEEQELMRQKPYRVIDYLSRNFGFDLTSIVSLARAEDRKKSLDAMVADLADALGLTKAQAQLFMQPVIQEAMKTVDTKRLEKAKKQIDDATVKIGKTGIRVPKKQQKTDAQRLVDLAKLGGLNLNNVEDVLLNVIGAKKFTPEFKAYLEMLIQKANDPSLPPITRADYNQVFIQEIQSAKGISLLGLYAEFYMSNIFMSILSTLKVNAVWGFVKSSADTAAFLAGNMVFKGEFGTKVSAKTTMALTKIYLRAFFGGTQNQAKYILKTGKTPQDFENDNLVKFQQSQMELLAAMPETEIRLYREGKPLSPFWAKKALAVSNFSKYTRRIMVATDAANRTPAMYMLRAANIARMIAMKGGSADITVEEIDSAMYGSDFKAALAAARAQAKREVASGVLGAAEEGIRTEEILNEGMGKSLGLSADDASAIFEQTGEYAKRWTVANKTEGVLGAISNNLVTAVRDIPGLSALMPAVRMPIGAFSQGIDWSPIGFLRYHAIKRNKGLSNSITNAIFNHDMSRAGWYSPHGRISEEQKNEMLIKASVGTALMLGLAMAIEAAIDDDEDKAAIYMTGRGPADIQKNKIWREKGNTPNMGRIYGVPFNFQESPAAPMFLTLGAWSDAKRYGKPGDGNSERLSYTFTRAMSGFLDAAVLKNLHDVLATFSGANSTSISSASNLTSRLVSVGLFPRLGGEINQILYGQMSKPDIEWAGKALSTVPFIPALFDKPALNWFGESIHGSRGNALGEVLPMLAHRISPTLSDDPQMLFVARMGANALTTTRRLKDGTEVAEDYDLMRKWATDSGVAVRKFLTPERMAYFEAMRAKDVPTAEKAFDKEISAIRTRILSSYPQVIFR
jgi:hypothetical protein